MARGCVRLAMCATFLLSASGCGPDYLPHYAPKGPSADAGMFMSLAYWPNRHFAVREVEHEGESLKPRYDWEVNYFHMERPSQAPFRTLCALVNTYFQDWERLVIIERVGTTSEPWFGYIVLGVTPDGPKALTNLEGRLWDWKCRLEPRRLRVDQRAIQDVLAELDAADVPSVEMTGLLWFEERDWPLYLLHDLRRDGREFSFGVRAYRVAEADWAKAEAESRDMGWDEISHLLEKHPKSECVRLDSRRGFELMMVGAKYAPLMATAWKGIMGVEDRGIMNHPYEDVTEPE